MTEHDLIDFEKAVESIRARWWDGVAPPPEQEALVRLGVRLVKEYREACREQQELREWHASYWREEESL